MLTAIGFGFIIASFLKMGVIPSLREKSGLITQGVYGIVRHPIYSGTIFAFFGLNLVFNSFISLLYLPVSIGLYLIMIIYEEKSLLNEYGEEYKSYQKNVPKRIIPFVI
ncbi:MAG: methyltransferase family protein [Bacteroidota bacterium]